MFRIYEGMKPARTFVTVQYNSTLLMLVVKYKYKTIIQLY